jgi:hypothetical protein
MRHALLIPENFTGKELKYWLLTNHKSFPIVKKKVFERDLLLLHNGINNSIRKLKKI